MMRLLARSAWPLGLLAAALGFYWLGQLQGAARERDEVTTASSEALVDLGKAYRAALARRVALQGAADTQRRRWRDSARTLEREARAWDSTVAAHGMADSASRAEWLESVRRWQGVAGARTTESEQCGMALIHCDARATLAEARADTLTRQLSAQVLVGSCRINLLVWRPSCPSRTTLFLLGALTGGGAALVIQ
jgi:hypothetical protein